MTTSKLSIQAVGTALHADSAEANRPQNAPWSAVKRMRLPHRPGMPLGSSSGGDTINDGSDMTREPSRK